MSSMQITCLKNTDVINVDAMPKNTDVINVNILSKNTGVINIDIMFTKH